MEFNREFINNNDLQLNREHNKLINTINVLEKKSKKKKVVKEKDLFEGGNNKPLFKNNKNKKNVFVFDREEAQDRFNSFFSKFQNNLKL